MSKGTRRWNRGFSPPRPAPVFHPATNPKQQCRRIWMGGWGYNLLHYHVSNECGISRQTLSRIGWWAEFVSLHWMCQSQLTRMCFPWLKLSRVCLWFHDSIISIWYHLATALQPWELGREALLGHLKLPVTDFLSCGLEWCEHHKFLTHLDTTIQITIYAYIYICVCVWTYAPSHLMLRQVSISTVLSLQYLCLSGWYGSISVLGPQLELIFTESQPGQSCLQQKKTHQEFRIWRIHFPVVRGSLCHWNPHFF